MLRFPSSAAALLATALAAVLVRSAFDMLAAAVLAAGAP